MIKMNTNMNLNWTEVLLASVPDLLDPTAELYWIRYALASKGSFYSQGLSLSPIRVEAARSNILARRASSAGIFGFFRTARFNQGFIKSIVSSNPSLENRLIIEIRDRCAAACSSRWWVGPGDALCPASILVLSSTKLQVSSPLLVAEN
jgi:hypothetical protein